MQAKQNMKTKNQIELTPGVTLRRRLALAVCAVVCAVGISLAQHNGKSHVKVTQLSQRALIEKLDGKDASPTMSEVNFAPGDKSRTRLLAVLLHAREARQVTIPQKRKE
jgi:hypothetical protein